jgi:hypothetical protein
LYRARARGPAPRAARPTAVDARRVDAMRDADDAGDAGEARARRESRARREGATTTTRTRTRDEDAATGRA